MADSYSAPAGPPPPQVPAGWKAQWNDQYKEWFYVNTFTKKSQWEKPTEPAHGADSDAPPGPPPGYDHSKAQDTGPEKSGLGSNNPYGPGQSSSTSEDEALARKLQAEEDAKRGGGTRGASDSYYGGASTGYPSQTQQYGQPAEQDRGKKGGFFSKLMGKASGSSGQPSGGPYPQQYQQQHYGQPQGYPPQGYPPQGYNQYPPQGYGQPQYGGPPPGGYYGGQPQYMQQQPQRRQGGLGAGGAAALGVGGGLVGGMLLADAIDDHDQSEYDQGYDQGYENGGGGDDYGGDDGGDMGGGDF